MVCAMRPTMNLLYKNEGFGLMPGVAPGGSF